MKTKTIPILLISLFSVGVLSACSNKGGTANADDKPFITQKFIDFTEGEANSLVMQASDGYGNGGVFGCEWSKDNIFYNADDGINLTISKNNDLYYGSEIKTITVDGLFAGGYFSTVMKPSNASGTASTFFLYTDNPHDEIDIEFLGKDTTKVQFNYFTSGRGGNEYMYDLGFDASEEYHTYGFYWDISKIIWYVDNKPVYQVNDDIPTHMMRLYMNFWCGEKSSSDIISWMGSLDDSNLPAIASYKNINYADIDGNGLDVPVGNPGDAFNENYVISLFDLGFSSTREYTVSKNNDVYDVQFTQKEGQYQYLAPNGYAALKFGEPKYSVIKVKNLSDFAYDFCLSYYSDLNEYAGLDGEVVSELGTTYLRKKGSTCLYYNLGPGDTASLKSTFIAGVNKFSKMNIMCAPNSNTSGAFSIIDWFVYDVDPVSNSENQEITKIDLMNQTLVGDYTFTKENDIYNVNFSQSPSALKHLIVNNPSEIEINKPQYSVIKIKNTSSFAYDFTLTFREVNNSYMTTGGVVVSTELKTTTYAKHGSTAEYFNVASGDTAELKVFINENATAFKLIEIIIEPKTTSEISGSFQILDWYIAQ